jgi:predicted metalloprotease with PDZ domain
MYNLDESIRAKTGGKKSLKDAMAPLAELDKPVSTAMFKAELEEINGAPLDAEFSAYVTGGKKPDYKAFFK